MRTKPRSARGLVARDVMHTHPVTVAADTPFLSVQHLFVVAQIGGAPVIDRGGKVVGVISTVDLLRTVDQVCDEDIDETPRRAARSPGDGELAERLEGWTAAEVATPEAVWVAPDAPVAQVARIMRRRGIHRVLVGAGGQLDGIVTSFDLLALVDGVRRLPPRLSTSRRPGRTPRARPPRTRSRASARPARRPTAGRTRP